MSRELSATIQRRARAANHHRSPSRGRGAIVTTRAAARDGVHAYGDRARSGLTGAKTLLSLAALVLVAVALLAWASISRASAIGPATHADAGSRQAATSAAPGIDPRLVLTPRTVAQGATAGGMRIELTTGPLLPGLNHFALRLTERGRTLSGVRVVLTLRMLGMAMRPVTLTMHVVRPGLYAATGPLSMFGAWQVSARIDRTGAAPLSHQFTLGMDLPKGLLTAPAAGGN